jgi:hypothetical protein
MNPMSLHQLVILGLLCGLVPWSAQAEEIGAAYGYTLGMPMSEVKVLSTETSEYGDTLHVVQPAADSGVDKVLLGASKDGEHVALIMGRSKEMAATDCPAQFASARDRLRKRYPDAGYYAMDDTDMIYRQNRNILISCEVEGDKARLVIEYRDDRLLK